MVITIQGSRGNEYTVDTEEVSCNCADFRFRCCRNSRTSEARQCKHLRQVFSEHPEYMPDDVARAMKILDEKLEQATNSNFLKFPKTLAETYLTMLTREIELIPEAEWCLANEVDFRTGSQVESIGLVVSGASNLRSLLEPTFELLGIEFDAPSEEHLNLTVDGFFPIRITLCSKEEYPTQKLFLSTPTTAENLRKRAETKGFTLTPRGLFTCDLKQERIPLTYKELIEKFS